jgi:imidazolonepropionase-like amidohydrolase
MKTIMQNLTSLRPPNFAVSKSFSRGRRVGMRAMSWSIAITHSCATAALTILTLSLAHATPNIPPNAQTQALLITGATLHPVASAAIPNGRMLIDKGRIIAIGDAASVPDRAGVTVVDLNGKHVYPGFIAANTSLGLVEVQAVRATVDTSETGALNPNSRALVAVNADSELLPVTRANGVLTALSVPQPSVSGLIAGTSALIQLDGWTWEEMGLVPEVGLHVALPSMRFNAALYPNLPPQRIEDMQRITQQRLRSLEDAFESAAAYAKARAADSGTTLDVRWEAMRDVVTGKRAVFIHAEELPQIRYALNFGERFGLKIVIVGGMDAWRIADTLRERKVAVIIGGIHRLPMRREDDADSPFRLAARLAQAGVKFAIARGGSTFEAATERSLPYEAATAAAYGLSRDEALKAITLYPAQILGAADKLGSLEIGKLATFIVTNGDPLDIRTQVERIYMQGRDVPLTDKQTKLNDKYEEKYRRLRAAPSVDMKTK